ncbi:hypothetical protein GCM10009795_045750 [Nocardioides hankookensis]|uniref:Contact-dependent growth inhibition system immunity protein n=1 Tax=Nocardioides hankookensis TaxID=443157 RepID=A0ABW1LQE5_9ACTN
MSVRGSGDIGRPAGRVMNKFEQVWESTWVHAVLTQDRAAPDGWWLLTGYPTPAIPREERSTAIETPALEHLAGAYFHQDWSEDLGDCDRVVERFAAEFRALAPLLPAEEGGYTGWLRHVAAQLR